MGTFIPNTAEEQKKMLKYIGFSSFDDMFHDIPDSMKLKNGLNIPQGMSEMEVMRKMQEMASENTTFRTILRGAGAYDHYIPSIVKSVVNKEEFVTAYTPYQAEISQGILQSIFEYQTMICELTGMDVSNASVYDGATAAAESLAMCRDRKRHTVYVSETTDPKIVEVMKTYCFGSDTKIEMVPESDGLTDTKALAEMLNDEAACFYVQQPNYYGLIEPADQLGEITHGAGAKYIMGCNPIALALIKSPAECGADIAVGEGQPLGMPLAYGGPYLGFMAATHAMMRKLPGRIVGETADDAGNRAYVLTLQAREQHIRREKASSNICSNQALCAMTAAVYMAAMGASGIEQAANLCLSKAHYLAGKLQESGLKLVHSGEFFHEFVTTCGSKDAKAGSAGIEGNADEASEKVKEICKALEAEGILGGLPLGGDLILWCATEKNIKSDLDKAAEIVKRVMSSQKA